MKAPVFLFLAIASALASPSIAQQPPPSEAQCRQMVDGVIQAMKSASLEKERDKEGARVVIARAEKVVSENRSRGVSECQSWEAVGRIVTGQ